MFCRKCGAQIPDNSSFCIQCGGAVMEQEAVRRDVNMPKKYKLTIFRESQMFLINPPVNLSINNQKSRSINNGETIVLELDEGWYSFEFSLHVRKKTVGISLTRDMQITLRWDRITGALKAQVI